MQINSLEFLIFLAIVVILYKIIPKKYKWIVLLVASYVFYFINSAKLTIFIILSTVSIYFVGKKIQKIEMQYKDKIKNIVDKNEKKLLKEKSKKIKRRYLAIGVLINIIILVILKYSGFIIQNVNSLFYIVHINIKFPIYKFILPLGISYYTLQAISYLVDVYRQKIDADQNIGRLALFLAFFPQMVEGPIGRYDKLANQLYEGHDITYDKITYGSQLMIWGYFKKMVIADRVAMYANEVFNNYSQYSGPVIMLGIICYTLQIYSEFSGGIDIIRGAAEIFGIYLDKNFERPFFSKSIDEFWRRWNITLGAWIRDYVFYPVSFSKLSIKITNRAKKTFKNSYISQIIPISFSLLCVWLVNGFWHGLGAKYIIYGLYYYVMTMLGKILKPVMDKIVSILKINIHVWSYRLWQIIRTFILVCFGMLIFRADNLNIAKNMFKSIFHIHNLELIFNGGAFLLGGIKVSDIIILIISTALLLIISIFQEKGYNIRKTLSRQNLVFRWAVLYGAIFSIIIFGIYGQGYDVTSFIYGQF